MFVFTCWTYLCVRFESKTFLQTTCFYHTGGFFCPLDAGIYNGYKVPFSSTFTPEIFFVQKLFAQIFSYCSLALNFFGKKIMAGAKAACKMLMKLTKMPFTSIFKGSYFLRFERSPIGLKQL